ncbi:MAG TPA: 30S ribosomal protein S17 [Candidatus Paceibacterota bacterium]
METETKKPKTVQTFKGSVISSKNHCTIVAIERIVKHPKYGKYIQHRKRFKAHDEADSRVVGEIVTIIPCPPISRDKRFKVIN